MIFLRFSHKNRNQFTTIYELFQFQHSAFYWTAEQEVSRYRKIIVYSMMFMIGYFVHHRREFFNHWSENFTIIIHHPFTITRCKFLLASTYHFYAFILHFRADNVLEYEGFQSSEIKDMFTWRQSQQEVFIKTSIYITMYDDVPNMSVHINRVEELILNIQHTPWINTSTHFLIKQ